MPDNNDRCKYCNSPLNRAYYFCLVCATPYRNPERDLSAEIPWPVTESEAIKTKAPHAWPLFWSYAIALFVLLIVRLVLLEGQGSMAFFMILSSIVFGCITFVAATIHWKALRSQFSRTGLGNRETYLGIALLVPLLGLNYAYHMSVQHILDVDIDMDLGLGFYGMLLLICVLPGFTEEIAFRGLIQHWLQVAVSPWRAIVLSSALFSALHLNIVSAPYLFLLGMLLGWVKWKTNSLYPCIFIHFTHNLVVILIS